MDKELKDKAVSIKGKDYVLVSDRVLYFNETYPNGSIVSEIVENGQRVTIKTTVTPDCDKPSRIFTGYSQATWGDGMVNKNAATENCETSAVGRALGFMGIGVIESIASADEMTKAGVGRTTKAPVAPQPVGNPSYNDEPFPDEPYNQVNQVIDTFGGQEVSASKNCEDCKKYYTPKPGTEAFSTKCVPCFIKSKK